MGLAGLYGAKRVRRSGALVGRTSVHSLAEGPTLRPPWEEVAFVDSVCLCLRWGLLDLVGGLDEEYGFLHGFVFAAILFLAIILAAPDPPRPAVIAVGSFSRRSMNAR